MRHCSRNKWNTLSGKSANRDMFSYIFMKILEQRPRSYDRRMKRATQGRITSINRAVAAEIQQGMHVLEIGCGTGELAAMLVSMGATVHGFDFNRAMIAVASERMASEGLQEKFTVSCMSVDSMDSLAEAAYDAVVSTLAFSELTDDERRFALTHAYRVLKPEGILVIADEAVPRTRVRRLLHSLVRVPLLAATYLVSVTATRPLAHLSGEVTAAGFSVERDMRSHGDAFQVLVARRERKRGTQ